MHLCIFCDNGYRIYVDTMAQKNVDNLGYLHHYWSVRSSIRRGEDGKGLIFILASYEFHFIREDKNLV